MLHSEVHKKPCTCKLKHKCYTYLKPKLSPILLPLVVECRNIQASIHSLKHLCKKQIQLKAILM